MENDEILHTIYVTVSQYNKHLIKNLLEENNISLNYNSELDTSIHFTGKFEGPTIENGIISIEIKNLNDSIHDFSIEMFSKIKSMITGNYRLIRTEHYIILLKENLELIKLPYRKNWSDGE